MTCRKMDIETPDISGKMNEAKGGYNPPEMDGGYSINSQNRNRTAGKQQKVSLRMALHPH